MNESSCNFPKRKQNNFLSSRQLNLYYQDFFFHYSYSYYQYFLSFFYKYLMDSILYVCFILYFFFFILLDVCIIISNMILMLCDGYVMSSVALYLIHIVHSWIKVNSCSIYILSTDPPVSCVINYLVINSLDH